MKIRKPNQFQTFFIIMTIIALIATPAFINNVNAQSTSDFLYNSKITFTNSCDTDYTGRLQFEINGSSLIASYYIQPDGEDIYLTQGGTAKEISALGLTQSETSWPNEHTTIYANSTLDRYMWFGDSDGTRDQMWVCSGSDTMVVSDHADLDVEDEFMLQATIEPIINPGTEVAILSKANAYELILNGTPSYIFRLYQGGTPTQVSLTATLNTEVSLTAWYESGTMTLSNGSTYAQATISGSINSNSSDIHQCEFEGLCDDVQIRVN